jgi:hypothetical protein
VICADHSSLLGKNINNIKKISGTLLYASIKIGSTSFESVLRYLVMTVTDQNYFQEEIKIRLNSGNACYHSVWNILSFHLLSKHVKNEILYKTLISLFFLGGCESWAPTIREER